MCPPANFHIVKPINAVQWMYYRDGLPPPQPWLMVEQHSRVVEVLRQEGVEVDLLPPVRGMPFQHATRDIGVVIGDTIVASPRIDIRQQEVAVAQPVFEKHGIKVLTPDRGFVEGGDVVVENGRIWVGIGARTDEWGAEYLDKTFGFEYDVIPLRFHPRFTHLDTLFGVLGQNRAILFEPAFSPDSLKRIKDAFGAVVSLTGQEQQSGGSNVLCIDDRKLISSAENQSVNNRLLELGYEVFALPFSEVIKSGGSVRCDTLPIERDRSLPTETPSGF
jgi:N-dimethylarginine dimethylaminohydrolase